MWKSFCNTAYAEIVAWKKHSELTHPTVVYKFATKLYPLDDIAIEQTALWMQFNTQYHANRQLESIFFWCSFLFQMIRLV